VEVWVVFFTGRAAGGVRGVVLEVLVRRVWAVFLQGEPQEVLGVWFLRCW